MSSVPHDFPPLPQGIAPPRKGISRRAKWDLALALGGVVYILLTLALNLNTPLVSILFIALAVRELMAGRER